MKPAIRVDNLSKQYRLGARKGHGYRTLRETIVDAARAPWQRLRSLGRGRPGSSSEPDNFWALKDVSFEVQPGEVVGVIGRNGAGKSTVLKILSRIVEPTGGRAELRGRIGSLLEVGTGFHPELTGRENIYLNGSILGMSRAEITRKFDEIAAFAEIDGFLDTPVKRYSSGMHVKLAFAVAANLSPEIMIVDEVLAVGDMAFQKKCLGKLHEVSNSGRTVMFVSHNMGAIQSLCTRCLVLDKGTVAFDGTTKLGIQRYGELFGSAVSRNLATCTHRSGNGDARVIEVELQDNVGNSVSNVTMGDPFSVRLSIRCLHPLKQPHVGIAVSSQSGQRLFRLLTLDQAVQLPDLYPERSILCEVPSMPLLPGTYTVSVGIMEGSHIVLDQLEDVISFDVVPKDVFRSGQIPQGRGDLMFVPSNWTTQQMPTRLSH